MQINNMLSGEQPEEMSQNVIFRRVPGGPESGVREKPPTRRHRCAWTPTRVLSVRATCQCDSEALEKGL